MDAIFSKRKGIMTLLLLFGGMVSAEEIKSLADAVNTAAKQRMLSCRVYKDNMMIVSNNSYHDPKGDLKKTIAEWEKAQSSLEGYVKDPKILENLKQTDKTWEKIKALKFSKESIKKATEDLKIFRKIFEQEDATVKMLVKKSPEAYSEKIDMVGRLRAISQQISLLYLLKSQQINLDTIDDSLKQRLEEFRKTLDLLQKDQTADPKVKALVGKLERIYTFFKILTEPGSTFVPSLVVKKADKMFEIAKELSNYYTAQTK